MQIIIKAICNYISPFYCIKECYKENQNEIKRMITNHNAYIMHNVCVVTLHQDHVTHIYCLIEVVTV